MCSRGHWRPAQDEKLRELVERSWNAIAEKLHGRSGKSCRLRWFNQLDPKINRNPFTEPQDSWQPVGHNSAAFPRTHRQRRQKSLARNNG